MLEFCSVKVHNNLFESALLMEGELNIIINCYQINGFQVF